MKNIEKPCNIAIYEDNLKVLTNNQRKIVDKLDKNNRNRFCYRITN